MDMHTPKQCFAVQNSLDKSDILEMIPFDSDRKMATLAVKMNQLSGSKQEVRVYCKGAPEILLEKSKLLIDSQGRTLNLDDLC